MQSLLSAKYYAKPDGEDYIGKMCATNRYAIQGALGAATMDVVMFSHPKGYLPTIARFAWWLGPAVGMASAFTTGTFVANKVRGKDDFYNYVAGSVAAAGVAGAWQRSPVIGFSMCLIFSAASAVKRLSIAEGWEFFPQDTLSKHTYGSLNVRKNDFSLTATGEKGYTTQLD